MKFDLNQKCVCQDPSPFNWVLPGILVGRPQNNGHRYIERCDACERFLSDEVACEIYVRLTGGRVGHDRYGKTVFIPK